MTPILARVRRPFRAVVEAVVPEAGALGVPAWDRVEAAVEEGLRSRPEAVGRQVALFLRLLDWMPVLRYGRRFSALAPDRRRSFLESLERAPVLLLRRGVWGVRTLAFMGFYSLPEVRRSLGYGARAEGWAARRGSTDFAPGPEEA